MISSSWVQGGALRPWRCSSCLTSNGCPPPPPPVDHACTWTMHSGQGYSYYIHFSPGYFYQDLFLLLLLTTLAHGHCTVDKDIHSHSGQRYSLILHSFWSIEGETFTQRNVHTNAATNTSRKAFISANTWLHYMQLYSACDYRPTCLYTWIIFTPLGGRWEWGWREWHMRSKD